MKLIPVFASLILSAATASPAMASPFDQLPQKPLCFTRQYDDQHLATKPLQRVTKMTLKFETGAHLDPAWILMTVNADLREENGPTNVTKPYRQTLTCTEEEDSLKCWIDCDGGNARVLWNANDLTRISLVNQGFVIEGACEENLEDAVFLPPKPGGDDFFRLKSMQDLDCKAVPGAQP